MRWKLRSPSLGGAWQVVHQGAILVEEKVQNSKEVLHHVGKVPAPFWLMQFVNEYQYLLEDELTEGESRRTTGTAKMEYIQSINPNEGKLFADDRVVAIAGKGTSMLESRITLPTELTIPIYPSPTPNRLK